MMQKIMQKTFYITPITICAMIFWMAALVPQTADASNSTTDIDIFKDASSKHMMVAAAHPWAVDAGFAILKKGGNAVDACIATQLVLNLVEPQSSGIGGGAFLLYWNSKQKLITAYDGRETAPLNSKPDNFIDANGKPLKFADAAISGRSVGVPGVLKMLELVHKKHGKLPWNELFDLAISLAETGFHMPSQLYKSLITNRHLAKSSARKYFYSPRGIPKSKGFVLINKPFANVLRILQKSGVAPFYSGEIAADIVKSVRNATKLPGSLSMQDMANYRAIERTAICATYREYRVCGMPPPSSGGVAVLQILAMLERFDLAKLKPISVDAAHLIAEASRLAFADRNLYIADPDFVPVPVQQLLNKNYLKKRSQLIQLERAMDKVVPGKFQNIANWGQARTIEHPSTSHISIVDSEGNAVSMTTSIEHTFGSQIMTNGFLLNNQLTDFSFDAKVNGKYIANRFEPGKRPRSSMSPIIVLDKNMRLRLVIGSPGGSRIIGYVAQSIIAILDHGLTPQDAVSLPHIINRNDATELEQGTPAQWLRRKLEARNHNVIIHPMKSGLQAILVTNDSLQGGADPRREGSVRGY